MQSIRIESQQKLLAIFFTGLIFILLLILLRMIDISIRKFSADKLAEDLNFKIYEFEEKIEDTSEDLETKENEKEKLALDEILDEVPTIDETQPIENEQDLIEPLLERELDEQNPVMDDDLGDVYDPGLPTLDLADEGSFSMGQYGDLGTGSGGIRMSTGSGRTIGYSSGKVRIPGRTPSLKGKNKFKTNNIRKIKSANKGMDDWAANEAIPKIKKWIEQQQKDIPLKVKMLLEYAQSDLTSWDQFEIKGIAYTIFLLYRSGQVELRLCLIYNDNYVQLIDSGMSTSGSNYLKKGQITWKEDNSGDIYDFTGNRLSPANPAADEFYNVFLSWYVSRVNNKR